MAKSATIYHNPKCTTSCNVLAMIEAAGVKPKVVEYLKTVPKPPKSASTTGGDMGPVD